MPRIRMDVDHFVDSARFSPIHFRIVAICMLLQMIDGYDLALLGWVAPALRDDLHISTGALATVISVQQIGMVLGAYLIAPLADRIGRRPLMIVGIAGVGIGSLGTLLSHDLIGLAALRLVTGAFGSAIIANCVSLVSEIAPKRLRATFVTVMLSGSMMGSLIGSFAQAYLIGPYGWRSAFVLGVAMPVVMLPIVYFLLPESLRFLAHRRQGDARLAAIVRALQPAGDEIELSMPPVEPTAKRRAFVRALFADGNAWRTILLWAAFASSFAFISAGFLRTAIMKDVVGLSWKEMGLSTAIGTVGGFVGMITIGIAVDRFGFRRVISISYFIAAIACVSIGVYAPAAGMYVAVAINHMFQHSAHAGLASIASLIYPTGHRAAGVGWAYGAGRVASVIAPMVMGFLIMGHGIGALGIFAALSVPLFLAGLFVLALSVPKAEAKA